MQHDKPSLIARFARWLFGAPFQELPTEFGDSVPSELRVFETRFDQAQDHIEGRALAPTLGDHAHGKSVSQNPQ